VNSFICCTGSYPERVCLHTESSLIRRKGFSDKNRSFLKVSKNVHAQDLEEKMYTKNIRAAAATERAGGYVETIGCLRALQEAMAGLYFMPVPAEPPEIILEN
jgi:hypothetical protein